MGTQTVVGCEYWAMHEDAGQRYEFPSVSCRTSITQRLIGSPSSFATFTPSPFFLLSATLASTLRVYNFATSKVLKTLRAPGVYVSDKHPCPAVIFDSLGSPAEDAGAGRLTANGVAVRRAARDAWVVSGSENGKVVLWDLGSRRVLQVLEVEGANHSPIVAIAVSPAPQPSRYIADRRRCTLMDGRSRAGVWGRRKSSGYGGTTSDTSNPR